MSLKIKKTIVNTIPPLEDNSYTAVCTAVIDLGEQYTQFDKQKQGTYKPQCMFIFEIPDERVEIDGESKPRWISSKRFTAILSERSSLFQFLTSWGNKDIENIDLTSVLGRGAVLTISQKEKTDGTKYNSIEGIAGLPKGIPAPKPESELLAFDADEPDMEVLEKLPTWIQDIIKKSTQFAENPPMQEVATPEPSGDKTNKQQSNEDDGEECPI